MNEDNGEKPSGDNKSDETQLKTCAKCHQLKPVGEFHRRRQTECQAYCKTCHREADNLPPRVAYRVKYYKTHKKEAKARTKKWSDDHREHIAKRGRAYHYKTYFNLSEADVQQIVDYQQGCCAMCGRPLARPNIDHDHKTGLVRGALCWPCNRLLGLAHDNPERLNQALLYLANPPATQALGAPRYGLTGRVGTKKQRKLAKKLKKRELYR